MIKREVELAIEMRKNGYTFRMIAEKFGVSKSTVGYALLKMGAHIRNRSKANCAKIKCTRCLKEKDISEFRLSNLQQSKFMCIECTDKEQHVLQLNRKGVSKEQYDNMLKNQNGVCAICSSPTGHWSKNKRRARLAVDHDHKTGNLRGLLCGNCNRGLRWFRDSKELLLKAVRYLESSSGG
jgi:predicted transcriptional regulator